MSLAEATRVLAVEQQLEAEVHDPNTTTSQGTPCSGVSQPRALSVFQAGFFFFVVGAVLGISGSFGKISGLYPLDATPLPHPPQIILFMIRFLTACRRYKECGQLSGVCPVSGMTCDLQFCPGACVEPGAMGMGLADSWDKIECL